MCKCSIKSKGKDSCKQFKMATYEKEVIEHSPDFRFNMGFTAYPVSTPEVISSGMTYNDYDWTQVPECVQPGDRTLYSTHDAMDQQYGDYIRYQVTSNDGYAYGGDASYGTPLVHVPYTGHENLYSSYTAISPSSSSCNTFVSTASNEQKPKRRRVQSLGQRRAANVRERKRMLHLNEAFDELRKRLPAFNYEKRLSRIETLRLAMTYIAFMKDVSDGKEPDSVQLLRIQRKSELSYDDSNESE